MCSLAQCGVPRPHPLDHILDKEAAAGVSVVPLVVALCVVALSTSWTGQQRCTKPALAILVLGATAALGLGLPLRKISRAARGSDFTASIGFADFCYFAGTNGPTAAGFFISASQGNGAVSWRRAAGLVIGVALAMGAAAVLG